MILLFRLFLSQLILVTSLIGLLKCDDSIWQSIDSIINPDIVMKNCTIGENCTDSINSTAVHYYAVQYTFVPDTTIRVTTNMLYNGSSAPILVVIRQVNGIISWTLPYEFSNGMIYSTVSRILCPHNEINRTQTHNSIIFIEISTSSMELLHYSIKVDNVSTFILQLDNQQEFSISPSKPVYYKVTYPPGQSNIFISVTSKDDICAITSVQSFYCPVYDVGEIGTRQGHYQTMSRSASINVYADELSKKNQFLLVFLVKPTDADCLDYEKSADIQPAGIVDIERTKNVTVILSSPTAINPLYAAMLITFVILAFVCCVVFVLMCKYSDIYDDFGPDQIQFGDRITEHELQEQTSRTPITLTSEGEENVTSSTTEFVRTSSIKVKTISTSHHGFIRVSDLCVKDYKYLQERFRTYPTTIFTIAIFYALPVIQLVVQYQVNIDSIGNEDICYFNFLCTRELFNFTAFNNILSNVGYCVLGILFFIIVYRRDKAYTRFRLREPELAQKYGIPQHFGLFYAMAFGLFMEGIMSACYHVCPSRQNFQFDTSFMFIIGVLNLIKIYQTRHADINPHSARTFSFLAIIIFITVIGVYFDHQWFWILYAIIHIAICWMLTTTIYYMGRLKMTANIHKHLYYLIIENGFFSRPRYINRMIMLGFANCLNIGFALYGAITQPESFPNHLLFVFLGNLLLYLIYYLIMKLIHHERFTRFASVSLLLSLLFWIPSLYFFYDEVKSYEVQPAISRTMNQKCILFNVYDAHDIWHLLSSFALFFSFLSLFTMDDGVRTKQRDQLAAF